MINTTQDRQIPKETLSKKEKPNNNNNKKLHLNFIIFKMKLNSNLWFELFKMASNSIYLKKKTKNNNKRKMKNL